MIRSSTALSYDALLLSEKWAVEASETAQRNECLRVFSGKEGKSCKY